MLYIILSVFMSVPITIIVMSRYLLDRHLLELLLRSWWYFLLNIIIWPVVLVFSLYHWIKMERRYRKELKKHERIAELLDQKIKELRRVYDENFSQNQNLN